MPLNIKQSKICNYNELQLKLKLQVKQRLKAKPKKQAKLTNAKQKETTRKHTGITVNKPFLL